jgi:peptidoglycan/xylan/chitin deacetylase (PgdA/CDA1 family)
MRKWLLLAIPIIILLAAMSSRDSDSDESFYQEFFTSHNKYLEKLLPQVAELPPAASSTPETIGVPILTYHSILNYPPEQLKVFTKITVTPAMLDKQFAYLKENSFQVISFDRLLDHIERGTPLPPKAVVITFDDGWEAQYLHALPLLKKYNYTATFFIFTNAIGRNKHFFTWEQVKELDALGMTIGSHSKTHPYLTKITGPAKLAAEIADSKTTIENHLGKKVRLFAYPFGQYNDATLAAVQAAGYEAARGTYSNVYYTKKDIYKLKSFIVVNDLPDFIQKLNRK